jgi:PAS domain-containing protein
VTPAGAFSLVYVSAAAIALIAAGVMWTRREAAGATPLALMLVAAAFWALLDAIELQVSTVDGKRLASQIQYLGVVAAAPCFFHAAVALATRSRATSLPLLAAVWGIPLVSLLMAWTNPWHGWMWTRIVLPQGVSPFTTYEYGWWFWVLTAQNYLLMIASTVILLRAIRRVSRGFRAAMAMVLLAVALPWVGNAMYNAKLGPWPGLNWLTLSLGISGWLLVWVVKREGLLDLLPQARGALIEMMSDGILVLDRAGRIMFGNRAADAFGLDEPTLASVLNVFSLRAAPVEWQGESPVKTSLGTRWLDIRVGPVFDRWGELAGRIVVVRDVTAQKELEDERERLVDELQGALRLVTQLEGLLPICASCHNVRDDHGSWNSIEDYIGSRTPLEFTHGICPTCMKRLYPHVSAEAGRTLDRPDP